MPAFKKNNPGCPCCECDRTLSVVGCNTTGIAGKVVTLKQGGVTIATCTSADGTGGTTLGQCTISLADGTYDVSVPAGDGFAAFSGTITHSCPTGGTSTIGLLPDASNVCVPHCVYPVPRVIHMTNGMGSHAFTYTGITAGSHRWSAGADLAIPGTAYMNNPTPPPSGCVAGSAALYTRGISFVIASANFTAGWRYGEGWGSILCGACDGRYASGANAGGTPTTSIVSATCVPFAMSWNVGTTSTESTVCERTANPAGGGTYSFTA